MQYGKAEGNIPESYDQRQAQMIRYANQTAPTHPYPPNPAFSTVSQNRS